MATSTDLKQRAQTLAAKTDINSIDPQEVGGLFYDMAGYAEDVQRNGGSLGIRKVYASVSAMEADSTSPVDMWGNPMRKGQLCVIYDGTTEGVDNNKVFAFKAPGWEIATQLDAGYATRGELAELEQKSRAFSVKGKGEDFEFTKIQVVPENIYKISFERLWSFSSSSASYLEIYYVNTQGSYVYLYKISVSEKDSCMTKLSVKIPEDIKKDNCNLYVGGRADVGEDINFEIENITDLVLATQDTMLLEQGGINPSTGAEEDSTNRVRTSTYVEGGRTIISYGNVLIWLVVYFDNSLSFVKALNPKNQLYMLESGYKAKVVFANEGGKTAITPADVYGESTAYLLSSGTNKSSNSNTTKSLKLEHGIYYNTPRIGVSSQSYSDLKPSSKIGRETFLLAKKTPNYIGGGSISIKTTANIIIHEFNNDGTYLASNFYPSTELVKTSGNLIKITAIPGSLVKHSLSSGSISSSGTDTDADNKMRSDYVDIDTFDFILIPKNEKLVLRCYNSSKAYITESGDMPYLFESNCGCIAASHIKMYYADVKHVRVIVGNVDDSTNFDGIDFYTVKSTGEVGEVSITSNSLGEIIKDFSKYGETTNCYYDTEVNLPVEGQKYYGKILIKTPKNYNNRGDKVPVVLFKSGSGTFNQISTYTFYYDTYIQYLVDCGFVVFDYHAGTSKYPNTDGFGTPTNIMAAHCAWDYVCEHYNVDESKLFIACKSLGGDIAAILSFSGLPVRAVGMLAPALNPARWCFGYTQEEQQVYAEDFGFEGDWQTVLDGSRDFTRETFKTLLKQNLDKLSGHLPMQLGVTNKMFEDLIVNQDVYNPDTEGTFDDVIRILKVPTKIWAAPDDTNTSINMHKNYIKSAQNGCSKAIMREMPEGTGGHHSVDNDPSAPQTTDITTRLGIHYDTMTTAWVELADWFIGYGG